MKRVATLCLIFSLLSFGQFAVHEYNLSVEWEESDRVMKANNDGSFSFTFCSFGIDYPARNRNLIFLLCIGAFLMTVCMRQSILSLSLSLFLYLHTALLAYQWITITVYRLSMAEYYMEDLPYLLRIASNFDWLMFAGLALAVVVIRSC